MPPFRSLAVSSLLWPLAAAVAATPYDGVYKQVANADCGLIGVDGGAIAIENNIFFGVELECRMDRPVDVVNMNATLYTMQCSGEDQSWSERALLMTAAEADGLIMLWDGYAFRYDRCPADTPAEEAIAEDEGEEETGEAEEVEPTPAAAD